MTDVKAFNLWIRAENMVNDSWILWNETSPAQDIESKDSEETQPVVVLLYGLNVLFG